MPKKNVEIKCKCGSKKIKKYEFLKCLKCHKTLRDNIGPVKSPKNYRLMITLEKEGVWIRGNRLGLELLANRCLGIIGKNDPGGHIHLEWQMKTLTPGSIETLLEYSNHPEGYRKKKNKK